MAAIRSPSDAHCKTTGDPRQISQRDSAKFLSELANTAKGSGATVWRFPDDKIGVKAPKFHDAFGPEAADTGRAAFIFGNEGEGLEQTAAKVNLFLNDLARQDAESSTLRKVMEKAAKRAQVDPIAPEFTPLEQIQRTTGLKGIGRMLNTYLRARPTILDPERLLSGQRFFNHGIHTMFGGRLNVKVPGTGKTVGELGEAVGRRTFSTNPMVAVNTMLSRMGKPGHAIALLFQRRDAVAQRILGRAHHVLQQNVGEMIKADPSEELVRKGFAEWVEKGTLRYTTIDKRTGRSVVVDNTVLEPQMQRWYDTFNEIDNEFYSAAEALGLPVKPKVGPEKTNPTGRYMPHRFDIVALKDKRMTQKLIDQTMAETGLGVEDAVNLLEAQGLGSTEDRMIRRLMENSSRYAVDKGGGKAPLTRQEATQLLRKYINKNAERMSGNMEKGRIGVEGYITDINKIYAATWMRNAYRLADTTVLGRRDHHVRTLITKIESSGHSRAAKEANLANKVYMLQIGRDQVNMDTFARDVYSMQAAKLSLALFANATQGQNTVMAVGLRPFLKAAVASAREGRGLPTFAERSGALPTDIWQSGNSLRLTGAMMEDIRMHGVVAGFDDDASRGLFGGPNSLTRKGVEKFLHGPLATGSFRFVEKFLNRTMAVKAGEFYADDLMKLARKQGVRALQPGHSQKLVNRLRELDLDPEAFMNAVQRKDHELLNEIRQVIGLRLSNATQFRSDIADMPLWANTSEMGRFFFQFKGFALGQARFMTKELSPEMLATDPARWARALAMIVTVYPAVGIGLSALRAELMGPTLATEELANALRDPTVGNLLKAGILGSTMAGGFGIMADIGATAYVGNDFALRSFAIPPVGSSILNGIAIAGTAARAAFNHDPSELNNAVGIGLREFGGLGQVGKRFFEEDVLGQPPEPEVDLLRAVQQAGRRLAR